MTPAKDTLTKEAHKALMEAERYARANYGTPRYDIVKDAFASQSAEMLLSQRRVLHLVEEHCGSWPSNVRAVRELAIDDLDGLTVAEDVQEVTVVG